MRLSVRAGGEGLPKRASVADRVEDADEAVVKRMECIGFRLRPCGPFIDRAIFSVCVAGQQLDTCVQTTTLLPVSASEPFRLAKVGVTLDAGRMAQASGAEARLEAFLKSQSKPVRVRGRNAGGAETSSINDESRMGRLPAFSLGRENAKAPTTPSVTVDIVSEPPATNVASVIALLGQGRCLARRQCRA